MTPTAGTSYFSSGYTSFLDKYELYMYIYIIHNICGTEFDPGPINVRIVVDKVLMREVFLSVTWFSFVNFFPPTFHVNLRFNNILFEREMREAWETFS